MTAARSLRAPRRRKYRVPRGFAGPATGLSEVASLGKREKWWRVPLAVLIGLVVHAGLFAFAILGPTPAPKPIERQVPVVVAQKLEPPKPPEPPPEKPPPPPPRQARAPRPAQAGKVVAAKPDPNAPVDMSGFSMVTGESQSFAGGYTTPKGTAPTPAAEPPRPRAPPGPDLSKPPAPASDDWQCQWPDDQRDSDLNEARVAIRVSVDRDGAPVSVEVTNSPSASFAEAARSCAMGASYAPAQDHSGHHIAATTPTFLVHFFR